MHWIGQWTWSENVSFMFRRNFALCVPKSSLKNRQSFLETVTKQCVQSQFDSYASFLRETVTNRVTWLCLKTRKSSDFSACWSNIHWICVTPLHCTNCYNSCVLCMLLLFGMWSKCVKYFDCFILICNHQLRFHLLTALMRNKTFEFA